MKKLAFLSVLVTGIAMFSAQAFAGSAPPPTSVPEPSTLHLMGTAGAAALGALGFYNIFKK
jgi:hypothetical protein